MRAFVETRNHDFAARQLRLGRDVGNTSGCTPQFIDDLCHSLYRAVYPETAARALGVNATRFYRWLQRGRQEPDSIYAELVRRLDQASAQCEMRYLDEVRECPALFASRAMILERGYRAHWARTDRVEVAVENTAKKFAEAEGLDAAEIIELAERMAHGGPALLNRGDDAEADE
jgi:hypothetical protein